MTILQSYTASPPLHFRTTCLSPPRFTGSILPFTKQKAKYHKELEAAVDVVERACHLCVEVKKSLFSSKGKIIEKIDQTPVTIADFGVQALVSLELGKLFPSIPLVAEEDSAFLRSNNLANSVLDVVADKAKFSSKPLTEADVLEAIDRGGKDASVFESSPATYWVLDPIDGTKGFLKGSEALYVVGLSLVVEGDVVLGVMGCPNWQEEDSNKLTIESQEYKDIISRLGVVMVSHVGCGTWKKRLNDTSSNTTDMADSWIRCFVDKYSVINESRFCISDSQLWESLPLSNSFDATTDMKNISANEVLILPLCCGSLCKYLMVASGRASVFILRSRVERIIKVWDHAVGIICVQEAGGMVTDWEGRKIDLAADQDDRRALFPSGGVLVTNRSVHDQILGLISSSKSVA
ncbi:putative PAP-specific phosphatase, mitochondrial [Heracleum sosnowskyi]|uniref:PAP-specific phosphatase, mitochondrial n=1 Tax=Heracleum sosnowskyi TaxID=360622 RepID=A0AAD8MP51_9APIA|nr:putative PAP-specific phosphatase, mitochondrial [Heracleum sosnowskyi]